MAIIIKQSFLGGICLRLCWNWQTGQLEVLVSIRRVGSSPVSRTSFLSGKIAYAREWWNWQTR